ncbi:hypothetical protein DOY81_001845 [Sarcophaga bullata]|nr:hypothetical protein DOY81_001845 [Sarcophaga bullata]
MDRICLVALIGLPALGKTTLCKYLMESSLHFNILHVCYDRFIQFNTGNPRLYKEQRENLLKYLPIIIKSFQTSGNLATELISMYDQYKNHNSNDVIILCDDNHYYRSMRYKLYQMAQDNNVSFCQIYFENNLQLALERNSLRSNNENVPKDVLIQMYQRLEPPNPSEHKWEENTLVLNKLDLNNNTITNIVSYITNILNTPVQPLVLPKPKVQTSQSLVHEMDLLMRKRITALMIACTETDNKQLLAKQLNDKRKSILKEFQLKLYENANDDLDLNKFANMLN